MVLFNHATREMTAKIVYYGPGLCGKTTNLLVIFDKLDPSRKGKMLSLATKSDRTLFFDLLPVDIGKIGAFNLKIQLYTVPGQVFYNETRKLVLRGADSIVFVVDSQPSMVESNRESFTNLLENLEENHIDVNDLPLVIQYNKRDIPGVIPVDELQEKLGLEGYPSLEASALKGEGVMETFKLVSKITAKHLVAKLQGKPSRIEKKEKGKRAAAAAEKPAARETAQAAEPPAVPFPETPPLGEGYEKMEEVSLEQLLEGRDRPTLTGDVPLPVSDSDIEELQPDQIIETADEPLEAAVEVEVVDETVTEMVTEVEVVEEPPDLPMPAMLHASAPANDGRVEELEQEVAALRTELDRLRGEHEALRDRIARGLHDLTRLVEP